VKDFNKARGWLIECVDGPLHGVSIRTWCAIGKTVIEDPQQHADAVPHRMEMLMHYGKEPGACCTDPTGQYLLEKTGGYATHKGADIQASQYRWHPHTEDQQ
jgi:hypothetical protein